MATNTYYSIYHTNTLKLVNSLVIKLDFHAESMQLRARELGIEDPSDKKDWIYYKHLAGEYTELDSMIYITSLDDGTTIPFTKDSLNLHKKTRSVYRKDESYVKVLKENHLLYTTLITGVLFPVDPKVAVNALDGTILHYDTRYVEKNESNLIIDIERWIRGVLYNSNMQGFRLSDNGFAIDLTAKIYAHITPAILDIRDTYMKTAQAHSFHVRSYLASNNRLDEFIPYLNQVQQLFLYRNIQYIEKFTGRNETFEVLLEKIMTIRNLPTFEYNLRQQSIDLEGGSVTPTPIFTKEHLNLNRGLDGDNYSIWDVPSILYKEQPAANDNPKELETYTNRAVDGMSYSADSNLPTKIVEVSAIDPDDLQKVKFYDTLLNEWIHLTAEGRYISNFEILNPLNGDTIKVNQFEILMMYLYAYSAGFHNMKLDKIPMMYAHEVVRLDFISDTEYKKYLPAYIVDGVYDKEIDFFHDTFYEVDDRIATAEDLLIAIDEINKRRIVRMQYTEQTSRFKQRGLRRRMYNVTYPDVWCDINRGAYKDYKELFRTLALKDELMSPEMWQDLALECLDKATAFNTSNSLSLRDIQAAMVRLFKRLSSYMIQFIEEVTSTDTTVPDSMVVSIDDTDIETKDEVTALLDPITIIRTDETVKATVDHANNMLSEILMVDVDFNNEHDVNIVVGADASVEVGIEFDVILPTMSLNSFKVTMDE